MGLIAVILAKLLDPVSVVVCFALLAMKREKWMIGVAAVIAAIATETVLMSTQLTRTWGEGLVPGLIASLSHAGLAYWIVGMFKKKSEPTSGSDSQD